MLSSPLSPVLLKFGFRIRTRHGLLVENLTIQARNEADAERKLRQMYTHCVILDCSVRAPVRPPQPWRPPEQWSFEDVLSLIGK